MKPRWDRHEFGWRKAIYAATFQTVNLGPSAFQRRLTAQKTLIASDIAGTLSRQARRAFLELAAIVADSFSSIRAAARY